MEKDKLRRRVIEEISVIRKSDPAARTVFEVLTCYPGLHAVIMYRVTHWLWERGIHWLGRYLSYLARWLTGIEIHPGAQIGRRLFIDHGMGIVIGETAVIGDDCTIYHGVTLGGTSLNKGTKRHPTLGNGVVVGAGAKILGNIIVGDSARVGSNAVVIKSVPSGATAVGVPARILIEQSRVENTATNSDSFLAYAVTKNDSDPLAKTLDILVDRSDQHELTIKQLSSDIKYLLDRIDSNVRKLSAVNAGLDVVPETRRSSSSSIGSIQRDASDIQ